MSRAEKTKLVQRQKRIENTDNVEDTAIVAKRRKIQR
jgi:hypothetical protein